MGTYFIIYHEILNYSAIIYASSYMNPLDDYEEICTDISHHFSNGCYLLFDLLLANGENYNRFVEAYFDGKRIDQSSLHITAIHDDYGLKEINNYYKGKAKELNNSILTPRLIYKYMRGE